MFFLKHLSDPVACSPIVCLRGKHVISNECSVLLCLAWFLTVNQSISSLPLLQFGVNFSKEKSSQGWITSEYYKKSKLWDLPSLEYAGLK